MFLMNCQHKEGSFLCAAFQREDGTIDVSPQGGGFVFIRFSNREAFDKDFEEVDTLPPYRQGSVTADFLADDVTIPCYSNGLFWNGWGIPWFDEAGIKQVIAALLPEMDVGTAPPLKWENGKLMVRDDFTDEEGGYFESEPGEIPVDGITLRLWNVDGWVWDAVVFPDDGRAPGALVMEMKDGSLLFWGERAQGKYEECIEGVWSPHGVGRVEALASPAAEWAELSKGDFDAARNSSVVTVFSENTTYGANKWKYTYWSRAGLGLLVQLP